jgi:Xaa-Pro aminopeptidase
MDKERKTPDSAKKKPKPKTTADPIPERLKRLREKMAQTGVMALLVSSQENRRYFSGFLDEDVGISESCGMLLLTETLQAILTDSRYVTQAQREAPSFETVDCRKHVDGKSGAGYAIKKLVGRISSISFEPEYMTVAAVTELSKGFKGSTFAPVPLSLGEFRTVKSQDELDLIKKAVGITEKSLSDLWAELEPGVPEEWLSNFLEAKFREYGAQGPAFPSIIAAGPNAALPHAVPGRKKIGKNEMVIIDIGARYKGYASDMTRTYVPVKAMGWQKEIYSIVREAQLMALEKIKAGASGCEVDKAARSYIASKGYGDYFGHALGHGVGLQVHEEPTLSPHSDKPLPAGSLVTVEPGIYIPGKGGVRLEELVLVAEAGPEILNKDSHFYDFS